MISSRSTLRHAAACTIALLLLAVAASAQTGPLTITNNTNCAITVCSASGAACVVIPGNTQRVVNIPCATTAIGIQCCGALRVIPLGNCVNGANIGGCCANVCFVPGFVGCTFFLTVNPSAVLCACPCP